MTERCETCRYWVPRQGYEMGWCHNQSVPGVPEVITSTHPIHWCDEYEAKTDDGDL